MEPEGMTNASTTNARKTNARMKATRMDSIVSLMLSLCDGARGRSGLHERSLRSVIGRGV